MGEADALRTAFDALLPLADPARQTAVLRQALKALLLEAAAPRFHHAPSSPRQPLEEPEGGAAWSELRGRVRAVMGRNNISSAALAQATGISHPTAQRILSPSSGPPGAKVLSAIEAWLGAPAAAAAEAAAPVTNGHAANGAMSSTRLSAAQRERLAALAQFTDPMEVRKTLGVTPELLGQAIAGRELAPEIVERLAGFLKHR